MNRTTFLLAGCLIVLACAPVEGQPLIDGVVVTERVFNDFPLSTLTTTNNFPSEVSFDEGPYGFDFGGFANRHDAIFSDDGGASERIFNRIDAFDVTTTITVEAGSIAPRKEAGIRLNSNVTGDGLFIVNTDGHEIVAFGGAFPFYSFNSNFGLSYNSGDTIQMRAIHRPGNPTPGGLPKGTIQYIVNVGGTYYSSPKRDIDNLEGGVLDGSRLGIYAQGAPNDAATDFNNVSFQNIEVSDPLTFFADANGDGRVTGADFTLWADHFGLASGASIADGDFNNDEMVTGADFTVWADNFGTDNDFSSPVPEPSSMVLGAVGLLAMALLRARR